jgi:NAD(P)-dependent dehydrogenase (short-subunit alcohol dehydrogenase family)
MDIGGRVALVTGGGVGTGRAIALALAAAGAEVVVCDIDSEGARATAAEAAGLSCRAQILDVTDAVPTVSLVQALGPRILVNNAGGGGHIPPHFPEAPREHWQHLVALNLLAPMWATQAALGPMTAAGEGVVVNVASTAGLARGPYQSPEYGAAKAGLVRFTTALGGLGGGVRVNCLVPDWVATERVTEAERASDPPPVTLKAVADAALRLVADDTLAGRVLVLDRGRPPRLLDVAPDL